MGTVKSISPQRGEKQSAFFSRPSRVGPRAVAFLPSSSATSTDRTGPGQSSAMARR